MHYTCACRQAVQKSLQTHLHKTSVRGRCQPVHAQHCICTFLLTVARAPAEDLRRVFVSFASFGARQALEDMDGAKFSKLCRDCRLLDRRFTPIDVDIVFAKAKVWSWVQQDAIDQCSGSVWEAELRVQLQSSWQCLDALSQQVLYISWGHPERICCGRASTALCATAPASLPSQG